MKGIAHSVGEKREAALVRRSGVAKPVSRNKLIIVEHLEGFPDDFDDALISEKK